jgi:hypothetical protein
LFFLIESTKIIFERGMKNFIIFLQEKQSFKISIGIFEGSFSFNAVLRGREPFVNYVMKFF